MTRHSVSPLLAPCGDGWPADFEAWKLLHQGAVGCGELVFSMARVSWRLLRPYVSNEGGLEGSSVTVEVRRDLLIPSQDVRPHSGRRKLSLCC